MVTVHSPAKLRRDPSWLAVMNDPKQGVDRLAFGVYYPTKSIGNGNYLNRQYLSDKAQEREIFEMTHTAQNSNFTSMMRMMCCFMDMCHEAC